MKFKIPSHLKKINKKLQQSSVKQLTRHVQIFLFTVRELTHLFCSLAPPIFSVSAQIAVCIRDRDGKMVIKMNY